MPLALVATDTPHDYTAAPDGALSEAVRALSAGAPVVITGSAEGPFVLARAECITPDQITLMAAHARGLVGMVITHRRAAELGLGLQPRQGRRDAPLYTSSIEAAAGTSTGISAEDRALTIRAAATGGPRDIITPGHIFPQVSDARPSGQAGLALRLLAAAGLPPVAAICTMLDSEGEVAGRADAARTAEALGLVAVGGADIAAMLSPDCFS
ncbi:3,4-dihydroxy-2-butanone-4-phosphate synthase [Poseidonocella sedimentorum]|uniref:3,4-dihydroxy-2-butanone 4-phosphate synthase n=1 Tax=Poseidonocella sedimentorum TaxID=871652 RepID=A0A1I6E320_9RHOB|nr:3,4-dihydroxy-2-butanone-4-phosphate synthase [Poseidonocella sedimentorum]SFR12170.1 3,4-dihydroxy-2-butanone 4-phosphate synthase [Poseidonocella sedimentorum]